VRVKVIRFSVQVISILFLSLVFIQCSSVKNLVSKVPGLPGYKKDIDMDAQAISRPGRIGIAARSVFLKKGKGDIACTVDIIDPTPDGTLGVGEIITFVVIIRNFSLDSKINPKLEISADYNNKPCLLKIVFLEPLNPGEKAEFRENVVWNRKNAGKHIQYKFRAFDNITKSYSLVMREEIIAAK